MPQSGPLRPWRYIFNQPKQIVLLFLFLFLVFRCVGDAGIAERFFPFGAGAAFSAMLVAAFVARPSEGRVMLASTLPSGSRLDRRSSPSSDEDMWSYRCYSFNKTAIPDESTLIRDCCVYYRKIVMNTGKSVVASSFLRSLV